ncbi:MAG: Integral rane sensor signal transduction histidine kinase [Pedosphaera sp.]|nr:Integral rane sensor signal transduction histidine kinase [Pedosphaera sp.]
MKKVALVFVLAVIIPSLVLAWLAVRSLRDQQFALERQQSLLYQGVADALARDANNLLANVQHEFGQQVETELADHKVRIVANSFDDRLRTNWPLAEVGFVVTTEGKILCPSPVSSNLEARTFRTANIKFLCNAESAEVYWNAGKNTGNTFSKLNGGQSQTYPGQAGQVTDGSQTALGQGGQSSFNSPDTKNNFKSQAMRNVVPQQQILPQSKDNNDSQLYSKVAASEAEFRQLIGDSSEGTMARFLENKLNVLVWYRSPSDPQMIFGAQLSLPRLKEDLKKLVTQLDPALRADIVAALLDDTGKPVARSLETFQTNWKRPFIATEVGESLPHWEIAVYLLNPAKLTQSAQALKLTLGLLIGVLLLAIAVGSWLIVTDLSRQLTLARQKTDFVSNVSHELKTPLTSIRMFSELLAEGRVADPTKQHSYLNIITAETARLTRLINNVLDFSRMERGEKKYNMQKCDLVGLVHEIIETYRPHLESNGFKFIYDSPGSPIHVSGDCDALAQVIVNLLSNAEKYSNDKKEIEVQLERQSEPLPYAEVRVLDRGMGVPSGSEEKIFEQFYRAHDSLSSGIQGSGLGLTLARQIAQAHGGDVRYQARKDSGSCFVLRLPTPEISP